MWHFFILLWLFDKGSAEVTLAFDTYTDALATREEVQRHHMSNTTFFCINKVQLPCDPNDFRRIDGSCNNLKYPYKGMSKAVSYRVLPPVFGPGWYQPRKAKSGGELPLPRRLRTTLLAEGNVDDDTFTSNVPNFLVFATVDMTNVQDTINFLNWSPDCCNPQGSGNPICAPNLIPNDDPIFRLTEFRCMNNTRPMTYQSQGCTDNSTTPERINTGTPAYDLSQLYGSDLNENEGKVRAFRDGLLAMEFDQMGREWPHRVVGPTNSCVQNREPTETWCYNLPDERYNSVIGFKLIGVWLWRLHNYSARRLKAFNPHWNDDQLFFTAREINIAFYLQVFLYEALPLIFGYDNMVEAGLILDHPGFRDEYNPEMFPEGVAEFPFVWRWGHVIQSGTTRFYTKEGVEYYNIPTVNLTFRTGMLMNNNNTEGITQGFFRQPSGKFDYIIDRDISNYALSGVKQVITDLTANDLNKNRLLGFPPYIQYLEHYRGKPYRTFDDLLEVIDYENVRALSQTYEHIEDIDLQAGVWLEKPIRGGVAPGILFNVTVTQLRRTIQSDRHWYERPNRPKAFTAAQLGEIRKATIAGLMCTVADGVTEIQKAAFVMISDANPLVSCNEIPRINYELWKETRQFG